VKIKKEKSEAEFLVSLLQSSVSHDPSEIILICWVGALLLALRY